MSSAAATTNSAVRVQIAAEELSLAASDGDEVAVRAALDSGVSPNAVGAASQNTLLCLATMVRQPVWSEPHPHQIHQHGQRAVAELLLARGADVHWANDLILPLFLAASVRLPSARVVATEIARFALFHGFK